MPVVDADGAAALARRGVLLDARAGARYRGETEPVDPAAGHIPGAVNAPATDHLDARGRWLPPEELAGRYSALGVTPVDGGTGAQPGTGGAHDGTGDGTGDGMGDGAGDGTAVGAYCGSGVTATAVILALEHARLRPPDRPAALFAGSWSQWSADPQRPVATGATP
jgi:thiosulfate/3-mercaptopyruvate sulfurtransferase